MTPGASRGPPSPPRNRNKKHPLAIVATAVAVSERNKIAPLDFELGERDADALVPAPDPTAAADELIGLDFKRE